jgi:L-aspartate oxidase
MVAGAGLCREEVVRHVIEHGSEAVRRLIELGTKFDRGPDGKLEFTLEGGHSKPRILHGYGDRTGLAVEEALVAAVHEASNVRVLANTFAIDLLTRGGMCVGALIWDGRAGMQVVWSRATILASGGAGQVFRETTNPSIATGDGLAMAFRAGAGLADMEFMQFHPTTLYVAGAARALISEAVRGEGGILRDRDGDAFMEGIHPLKDLAPRDIVSRAIVRRMRETQDTQVYLDVSSISGDRFRKRFPYISELCDAFDVDFVNDPIPVRPSAHYMVGGVAADLTTRTTLSRLFACGECACTTFHGANRLGSNSLLEGAVFGKRAGEEAARSLAGQEEVARPEVIESAFTETHRDMGINHEDLRRSLQSTMTYNVGVERDGDGLSEASRRLGTWARYALDLCFDKPSGWELQNLITNSLLIARQAGLREESRGVHHRRDFPKTNDAEWQRHVQITLDELA